MARAREMPHRVRRFERVVLPRGHFGRRVRLDRLPRPPRCAVWCPPLAAARAGRLRARPTAARSAAHGRPRSSPAPPPHRAVPRSSDRVGDGRRGVAGGALAVGGRPSRPRPRDGPSLSPFFPHYRRWWGCGAWRVGVSYAAGVTATAWQAQSGGRGVRGGGVIAGLIAAVPHRAARVQRWQPAWPRPRGWLRTPRALGVR